MIRIVLDLLHTLTDPEKLIQFLSSTMSGWYGYLFLCLIVFSETGLLIGFFLPGDSLMFTIGVVAGAGGLNIWVINALLITSAIVGNSVGYTLGKRAGPHIFNRPSSRFFNREHLTRTHEFYEKYGGKTIVMAQFIPILRTFAPFVAGVAEMSLVKFLSFNVFGSIGWVASLTTAGYFLGGVPIIRRHFEKVVVGIVLVSVLPIVIEYLKSLRSKPTESESVR